MILLIDNYDSFTYNLLNYCRQFYPDCELIRNDECSLADIEAINPDGFVFSPGPGRPEEHPLMRQVIDRWHTVKPMLGICLGFQAIASYFGAAVINAPAPVHGKVSSISHSGHSAFDGIPTPFSVTRYHSLCISRTEKLKDVAITARTVQEGLPMALAHHNFPAWGFQYHPEAILTEHGLAMIENWLKHYFMPATT